MLGGISMKNVLLFPINIFVYAAKGVKSIFRFVTGGSSSAYSNKLVGASLEKELTKVKKQSTDFKHNKVDLDDKKNSKTEKNVEYKYIVKSSNGQKLKGKFEAPTKEDVRIFLVNNGYEIISIEPSK